MSFQGSRIHQLRILHLFTAEPTCMNFKYALTLYNNKDRRLAKAVKHKHSYIVSVMENASIHQTS